MLLSVPSPFSFHVNFMKNFWKKFHWDLNKDCIECVDHFGECCHLNNTKFCNLWTRCLFIYLCLLRLFLKAYYKHSTIFDHRKKKKKIFPRVPYSPIWIRQIVQINQEHKWEVTPVECIRVRPWGSEENVWGQHEDTWEPWEAQAKFRHSKAKDPIGWWCGGLKVGSIGPPNEGWEEGQGSTCVCGGLCTSNKQRKDKQQNTDKKNNVSSMWAR